MRWAETMWQDARYAVRAMRSSAGLTAVAVLSLALGIGATTAIFSVMYALTFRPLPVQHPDRLAQVMRSSGVSGHSYAEWREFRERQDTFSSVLAYNTWDGNFSMAQGQETEGLYVSGDFFRTFGVPAVLGRTLTASDDEPGAAPVCVIGYALWREQYGESPSVLGKTIVLDGHGFQIIGVTPRSFFGVEVGDRPEVFMTLEAERTFQDYQRLPNGRATPSLDSPSWILRIVGRLKPGVSLAQADARLKVLGAAVYKALPPIMDDTTGKPYPAGTLDARAMTNGISYARSLYSDMVLLLLTMAGVALIIACANLGNLLLARATRRQGEIATRLALGATRWRLIRQLLTESVALAAAGCAVGLLFARWGSEALISAISLPGATATLDFTWDAKLVAFAVGTTLLCALLFGLAPAMRATRVSLYSAIHSGGNAPVAGGVTNRLGNAVLIVVQVALSMALLVSAGLLVRTAHAMLAKDPGYDAKGVLVAHVIWDGADGNLEHQEFQSKELLEQFRTVPGVVSASGTAASGGTSLPDIIVSRPGQAKRHPRGYSIFVTPGFFATRLTPMLSGRDFSDSDDETSLPVAILSDTAARVFFPEVANPVGLRYRQREEEGEHKGQEYSIEVVGISKDIDYQLPNYGPLPIVYRPVAQCITLCSPINSYEIRFAGKLPDLTTRLKDAAETVDSHLTFESRLLSDEHDDGVRRNRAMGWIATLFGLFAGFLAMIGVYGVTSYAASQRTREIGIRMTLGAQRGDVFRMILRETIVVVFIGVALGVVAGYDAAKAIQGMLWGVKPTDSLTFVLAGCAMLAVATIAAFLPARRAAQADPMAALRAE